MYLKVCVWLNTQETPHRDGAGYFIHDDGHMIPTNSIKSSARLKKKR